MTSLNFAGLHEPRNVVVAAGGEERHGFLFLAPGHLQPQLQPLSPGGLRDTAVGKWGKWDTLRCKWGKWGKWGENN